MKINLVILGDSSSNHIIKWAKGARSSGHSVCVISCGGDKIENIQTINYGGKKGGAAAYLKYKRIVGKKIAELKPDLIHVFQATGYAFWGAVKVTCPRILTPMGSDIMRSINKNFIFRQLLKNVIGRYDYFTTASVFLKNELNRIYPHTVNRTIAIPFGVEPPDRIKNYRQGETIRIVYMRHLLPVYGPDVLLRAMKIVCNNDMAVELDMYGFEHKSPWVRKMVGELGISSIVRFKGWIHMDLVMPALADYDLMVMPSRAESFGVAALEAGAVGLPTVASNVGGIPEIIEDGRTGILVPPDNPEALADGILKLAGDAELRKKMGMSARKRVEEKFHWNNNLMEMMRLYERLIAGEMDL